MKKDYVVTFDTRSPITEGTIRQLRRMTIGDAQALLVLASFIPKRGVIVNAKTLAVAS